MKNEFLSSRTTQSIASGYFSLMFMVAKELHETGNDPLALKKANFIANYHAIAKSPKDRLGYNISETVPLKVAISGRTFESFYRRATPHPQGKKVGKFLHCYDHKHSTLTLNWKYALFIVMHISTMIGEKVETPKDRMVRAFSLLVPTKDGKFKIDESIYKNKMEEYRQSDKEIWKGTEDVTQLLKLTLGFNYPSKYGYCQTAFVDAASQNWSIYSALLVRDADLIKHYNFHINSNEKWFNIKSTDPNTRNAEIFIQMFSDDIRTLAKEMGIDEEAAFKKSYRNLIKYLSMTSGFGATEGTRREKALEETPEEDRDFMENLLNQIGDKRIDEFLNTAINGFEKFRSFVLNRLSTNTRRTIYTFNILNKQYAQGKPEKKVNQISLESYTSGITTTRYKTIYTYDNPKSRSFQRFKLAYLTHSLDAYLVEYTRNYMYKVNGYMISTNHDSYGTHPQAMFDLMQTYLHGFKTLMKIDAPSQIVKEYSNGKIKFRNSLYFVENEVNPEDFINTNSLWFINHIWAN